MPRNESPPSSKKLSLRPTRSTLSSSPQMAGDRSSRGRCAARRSRSAGSGAAAARTARLGRLVRLQRLHVDPLIEARLQVAGRDDGLDAEVGRQQPPERLDAFGRRQHEPGRRAAGRRQPRLVFRAHPVVPVDRQPRERAGPASPVREAVHEDVRRGVRARIAGRRGPPTATRRGRRSRAARPAITSSRTHRPDDLRLELAAAGGGVDFRNQPERVPADQAGGVNHAVDVAKRLLRGGEGVAHLLGVRRRRP